MRILIAEDERETALTLVEALKGWGYSVETCRDGVTALHRLEESHFDLLIADLELPGEDGLELLRSAKNVAPGLAVIITASSGTVGTAAEALRLGAEDCIIKPFLTPELVMRMERIFEFRQLVSENTRLRGSIRGGAPDVNLIGTNPAMTRVFELIDMVAPGETPVLIEGESGTGKQAVARAIHGRSPRAEGPFIVANCSVLSGSILERELFGREPGTVAGNRSGRLGRARGGTLFLDDIDQMNADLQARWMRFLLEGNLEPSEGAPPARNDVRLVTASRKRLAGEVKRGVFREDLHARLSVVNVRLPPLRERPEDIPHLAVSFLARFARESGGEIPRLSPETLEVLVHHPWPGNVRQLENAMMHGASAVRGETVTPYDLPGWLKTVSSGDDLLKRLDPGDRPIDLNRTLEKAEQELIRWALGLEKGNTSAAARRLGLPRTTLITRMGKLGIGE